MTYKDKIICRKDFKGRCKMSLKAKLVSCIVVFVIVVSIFIYGVYAATNVTLNIGGNVSFTATSVNALVTGSVVGTASNPTSPLELDDISLSADTTNGAVTMPPSWQNVDLTYGDNGSPITITITIENRSPDRGIDVTLTDSSSISNVTIIRKCNDSTITTVPHNKDIGGGEIVTYTFELTLNSRNNPASGTFSLGFNLQNDPSVA